MQNKPAVGVAIGVLVGFGLFLVFMVTRVTGDPGEWTRYVYLYGGVEAIAFTAAGFLFGKEVHRQEAANEKQRADQQTENAKVEGVRAEKAVTAGGVLRDLIVGKAQTANSGGGAYGPLGAEAAKPAADDLAEIADLARKCFPE